jgi:hypothetical protein
LGNDLEVATSQECDVVIHGHVSVVVENVLMVTSFGTTNKTLPRR